MNKDLQKYYEDRFGMMATKGWQDLLEDVTDMLKATNQLGGVENEQQLYFKKGEVSILQWLVTLRDSSAEVYEQLQNEVEDAS